MRFSQGASSPQSTFVQCPLRPKHVSLTYICIYTYKEYVYVYVYVYIYMNTRYICTHVSLSLIYIYIYLFMHVYIYMYAYIYIYKYHISLYLQICVGTWTLWNPQHRIDSGAFTVQYFAAGKADGRPKRPEYPDAGYMGFHH